MPIDVDRHVEGVEDLVECPEVGIVAPAVDVGGFDIENVLLEPFGNELLNEGFADPARAGGDGRVGGFTVRN
jgi:hypothetical protein